MEAVEMPMFEYDEISKWQKKRNKKRPPKSNHKHNYIKCIGKKMLYRAFAYIPIKKCSECNKIVWIGFMFTQKSELGYTRMLTKLEDIQREYPDLEVVETVVK